LQVLGKIRRVPINGRLDQQRYRYALWKPNPLDKFKLSAEQSYIELARRYFRWIGPAGLAEFQWFSALGVKASKAAIESLRLVPVESHSDRLMFADDRDQFAIFETPANPAYALVSSVDSMFLLRHSLTELLTPQGAKAKVYGGTGVVRMSGLSDLCSNAILDRGAIVGLWEFDLQPRPSRGQHSPSQTKPSVTLSLEPKPIFATSLATPDHSALTAPRAGFRESKPSATPTSANRGYLHDSA